MATVCEKYVPLSERYRPPPRSRAGRHPPCLSSPLPASSGRRVVALAYLERIRMRLPVFPADFGRNDHTATSPFASDATLAFAGALPVP